MSDAQVVIVGAGPAGALLSLVLARSGIETCLVERQTDFERSFRGEVLMPSGLAMLDQVGIDLSRVTHRRPDHFTGYLNGKAFFDLKIDPNETQTPLCVSQPALLEHLVSLADQEPCFRFLPGTTVREIETSADGDVRVRASTAEGEEHLQARLVVGADGRASVVRKSCGYAVRNLGAPMDIVWAKIPWPESWQDEQARFYMGGGHLLLALPAPDGQLQLAWVILKGHFGELKNRGIDEWVRAMCDHVDEGLASHLAEQASNVSRPFLLDAQTSRTLGWSRPGTLLIGDAAHTMSPVGAQGLNVAMRDAVVAANHLVPALLGDGDLDTAAARVEAERGPEIDTIQRLAALPPRFVLGRTPIHALARHVIARVAGSSIGQRIAQRNADLFLNGTGRITLSLWE